MDVINNGGAAFPVIPPSGTEGTDYPYPEPGMSLRDWFAGQFLSTYIGDEYRHPHRVAAACYEMADAMLAERNRRKRNEND